MVAVSKQHPWGLIGSRTLGWLKLTILGIGLLSLWLDTGRGSLVIGVLLWGILVVLILNEGLFSEWDV
jgi:hypothetical protein